MNLFKKVVVSAFALFAFCGFNYSAKVNGMKVVLLGDSGTGKTAIYNRILKNEFKEGQEPTIGAMAASVTIGDCKFSLWDTAGEEKFRSATNIYLKGANAAIIVFDLSDNDIEKKLNQVNYWINWVNANGVNDKTQNSIFKIVVGNKLDLKTEGSNDLIEKVSNLCSSGHEGSEEKIPFFEASALTGEGIADFTGTIVYELKKQEKSSTDFEESAPRVNLTPQNNELAKQRCCK